MTVAEKMKKKTTLSFEVFPPKTEKGMEKLPGVLDDLYRWDPDWISCTYGAGGSDKGYNLEIVKGIRSSGKTTAVSHYTCIHHSRDDIRADIDEYLALGVDHFLALRGDYVPGENETHGAFQHADGLIRYMREQYGDTITIACSGIPEGHILSPDMASDTAFLKRKQDAGADFIITQLTFDMEQFSRWRDEIDRAGVTMPIAVGLMPVLDRDKCIRHCVSMNGCAIPRSLARHISKYYDDPEGFRDAGMDYTVQQMYEYIRLGVNDLHIYALNQSAAVDEILRRSGLFSRKENGGQSA